MGGEIAMEIHKVRNIAENVSETASLESRLGCVDVEWVGKSDKKVGWRKVVDVEEARNQILLALPLIVANAAYLFIPMISVMFAGHLGELELASSNLANSWSTVTGHSLMIGLSGALETLCGQGYGAKLYKMLGIYLQASCFISITFSLIISLIWWFTEPILILLKQDPNVSKMAALYLKYYIPGLVAYGILNNILRFLQSQSVVIPIVVFSLLPLILHIGLAYSLVHWTSLRFVGSPIAASISMWISVFMLIMYVFYAKNFKETWQGFSLKSLNHVFSNLKLALPSAAMTCLEYGAFEVVVLLAGQMPNSEVSTSLIAMCVNTEAIAFTIAYGLSATASTRVSNELGASHPDRAKHAMFVTLKLNILLALCLVLALGFGHRIWAGLFSDNSVIINKFASMTPWLLISITVDFVQGILSGFTSTSPTFCSRVARGCGWQHLAVYINLTMFYFIGLPIAAVLAFKFKLYAKGLWIGLICGLSCQAVSLMSLTYLKKWTKIELIDESNNKENPIILQNQSVEQNVEAL